MRTYADTIDRDYAAIADRIDREYEALDSACEAARNMAPGVVAEFRKLLFVDYAGEDVDPVDVLHDIVADRLAGCGLVADAMREELLRTLEEGESKLVALAAANL